MGRDALKDVIASVKGKTKGGWRRREEIVTVEEQKRREASLATREKERAAEATRLKQLANFVTDGKCAAAGASTAAPERPAAPLVGDGASRATAPDVGSQRGAAAAATVPQSLSARGGDGDPNLAPLAEGSVAGQNGGLDFKKSLANPLSRREVIARLREAGAPATLFGESDTERYGRYCELRVTQADDEIGDGQRNLFALLLRTPKLPRGAAEDDLASSSSDSAEAVEGRSGPGMLGRPAGDSAPCAEFRVVAWLREVLVAWEAELVDGRGDRLRTAQFLQTREDLRPLLQKLQTKTLDPVVLAKLDFIVDACKKREYKLAHDKYIELSIGNAAWPIGVTMVGIHERVGRSRIATSEIAHILNDETTRKYMHMIKRLISICQRMRPTDPSKMVCISSFSL